MALQKLFFSLLIGILVISCTRSNEDGQTRLYVKGKLATSLDLGKLTVRILANNHTVATTIPNGDASFVLSGPVAKNNGFAVTADKKIISFSAATLGLTLSADSLQILIPKENSYVVFDDITLKP